MRMLAYGQPTATPGGDGENPQSHPEEQTLGLGKMGVQGGGEIGFGKCNAQPRTPEKGTKKRYLTPSSSFSQWLFQLYMNQLDKQQPTGCVEVNDNLGNHSKSCS